MFRWWKSIRLARALLVLSSSSLCSMASADGPPGYGPRRAQMEAEYGHRALDAYGRGYAQIESAHRLDLDAAASKDERTRSETQSQATQKYEDALRSFREAASAEPRLYEAHTYIGYTNRKLGRYDRALAAYEQALRIKPDYAPAIEYQGETFLALDRFEQARFNYLRLYALDGTQARKLLDAMHAWIADRERHPGALTREQLTDAAEWITARGAAQPAARDSRGW